MGPLTQGADLAFFVTSKSPPFQFLILELSLSVLTKRKKTGFMKHFLNCKNSELMIEVFHKFTIGDQ